MLLVGVCAIMHTVDLVQLHLQMFHATVPALALKEGEVGCPPQVQRLLSPGTVLLNVMLMVLTHSTSQVMILSLIATTVTSQLGAAVGMNNNEQYIFKW